MNGREHKPENLPIQENTKELASFMMAKIGEAYIHPPLFTPAEASIREAALIMKDNKATSLLVRRDNEVGIVTGIDLREAVIIERVGVDSTVGDIASYELITLEADDFLFNALLLMIRHTISRVIIRKGGEIVGILEQIDLLGFLSNHSHLVAIQIERASSKQELQKASHDLIKVIQVLHAKGVEIRYISQLITELNRKIFTKLYTLLAPPELIANSCLLVMGSEGREEQILKTDQDNALILRDGFDFPDLQGITQAFTEGLVEFGYPQCPGNIMVSNPYWAKPLKAFKEEIRRWIEHPDEESFMQFAIFFDARAVAGDQQLLQQIRDSMFNLLRDNEVFYSLFAKVILDFRTPLSFFNTFVVEKHEHRNELDIKKGGIFPIVHGIRSLALEHRLRETNTIERIEVLEKRGQLSHPFAIELTEAFAFMCSLRLKAGLRKIEQGAMPDNYINPNALHKLERDLLRDSFKIVNQLKKFITQHFKLNLLG